MPLSVELRKGGRNKAYWYWRYRSGANAGGGNNCCLLLLQGGVLQLLQGGCLEPLSCQGAAADLIELEDGTGTIELEDGTGSIELE